MRAASVAETAMRALQPYVPRLAIEWVRERPEERHLAVDGTLAFVDISGFTRLSERLGRVGRAGPEELSDILDSTFGALLAATRTAGADLVKWGGDAVLLLFRGPGHATRAVHAAARMRAILREVGRTQSSAGRVTLRMSVGVHSGRFDFFLVGDPDVHRELIVCGPAASVTAEMEAIATAGQIAVSDATAELLPRAALGAEIPGGRLIRSAPTVAALMLDEDDDAVDVAPLLPPPIRAHLLAAAGASEHRPIAVAFVQFSDTDALIAEGDIAGAVSALDACVRNVQEACAAHDVTFLESDINRDGGKFMLISGAPRSSGDDDDRLLRAVQTLVARQGRLPLRAGLNHGRVFAGDFGPAFRRTYSVKGDAVNVAARVMGKAESGTALATSEVLARARTSFLTTAVPPFMVKGKSKAIDAAVLGPPASGAEPAVPANLPDDAFIGREAELATLREALELAGSGRGSLIDVIGEPGMGKSRLVAEFVREARGFRVLSAPSSSYESKTPYHPFRALLRELLDVGPHHGPDAIGTRLAERAVNAPHLLPWLPLLGAVLDVELPSTLETEELDERFRGPKLEEVLVEFLEVAVPRQALLVFENTHLMDDASAELLRRVEATLSDLPWLVLATRRDIAAGYVPSGEGESYRPLRLTPIVGSLALDLLESETRAAPLSEHTMRAIAAKAGGNPLFLKALVTAAVRAGGGEDDLPDSVEAVLTSEIDRLDPRDRTLLRFAAVLGIEFSTPLLKDMLVASGRGADDADLGRLSGFVSAAGDDAWRFRHALIRDVAYAGLPYRLRRQLHDHAGRVIEATTSNLDEVSERLSLHFFHAGDHERAWTYSRMAGRRAQGHYAYTSAIEFYRRGIESGRLSGIADAELADVLESLGDVCDIAGFSADAIVAYRRARPFRRADSAGRAGLLLKEAGLHQRRGAFATSLRLLSHARGVLRDCDGPAEKATRSRLATRFAFGKYLQGDYAAAVRWSEIGVREAKLSGDRDALAFAYNTRHLACIHAGVEEDEPYGELALATYAEIGDLRMEAHCLNNLAIGAMHEGQWDRSADMLDQAATIFRRVGDTANEANAQYNQADLLIRQRRFAEAEPLLTAAARAAQAADDRELVALATRESGRVRLGLGHPEHAITLLEHAREGFADLGLPQELIVLDGAAAECLLEVGDPSAALDRVTETLAQAHEQQVESALAYLHRVRGLALHAAGRDAEARDAFAAGMRSPASSDGRSEYALNVLALAQLTEPLDPADADRLRRESEQILEDLGVLTPPRLASA
jgi:class 3 adenylate cyclase/tetratricopeptide (TPR) repeat protein